MSVCQETCGCGPGTLRRHLQWHIARVIIPPKGRVPLARLASLPDSSDPDPSSSSLITRSPGIEGWMGGGVIWMRGKGLAWFTGLISVIHSPSLRTWTLAMNPPEPFLFHIMRHTLILLVFFFLLIICPPIFSFHFLSSRLYGHSAAWHNKKHWFWMNEVFWRLEETRPSRGLFYLQSDTQALKVLPYAPA